MAIETSETSAPSPTESLAISTSNSLPTRSSEAPRELDPTTLGFENDGDFEFDTTAQPGNSNADQEYGETIFSDAQRAEIIEYLKTL